MAQIEKPCLINSQKILRCSTYEQLRLDSVLERYMDGEFTDRQSIDNVLRAFEDANVPYQAALILHDEITSKRRLATSDDFLRLNELYLEAREDEIAYEVLVQGLKSIPKSNSNYSKLAKREKKQKILILENDPRYIEEQIYINSPLRILEREEEKRKCIWQIKQTYRVDGPLSIHADCEKYRH